MGDIADSHIDDGHNYRNYHSYSDKQRAKNKRRKSRDEIIATQRQRIKELEKENEMVLDGRRRDTITIEKTIAEVAASHHKIDDLTAKVKELEEELRKWKQHYVDEAVDCGLLQSRLTACEEAKEDKESKLLAIYSLAQTGECSYMEKITEISSCVFVDPKIDRR